MPETDLILDFVNTLDLRPWSDTFDDARRPRVLARGAEPAAPRAAG